MIGGQAHFVAIGREGSHGPIQQSGIVHQHVEAGVAGVEFGGGAAHLAEVGQVGQQHVHPVVAGGGLNFAPRGFGLFGVAGQQHYVGTHLGQGGGGFFANARSGTSDEDKLILHGGHKRMG